MKKKTKKVSNKKKTDYFQSNYTAVLTMDGKSYQGEGATIFDAMTNIPLDYTQIKIKGILEIAKGKLKTSKLFYLKPLKRIFANKLTRQMWAKNLLKLLESEAAPMSK